MYCKKCGFELSEKDRYCFKCGQLSPVSILSEQLCENELTQKNLTNKNTVGVFIAIIVIVLMICIIWHNYSSRSEYENMINGNNNINTYNSSYNNPKTKNYFNQLTIGKPSVVIGKMNNTVYIEVTNNSSVTLTGTLHALFYQDGIIIESAVIFLPTSGLEPNETTVVDGIFKTSINGYDNIKFVESCLDEK